MDNRERQESNRRRRAACYNFVKQLAHDAGYMRHQLDVDGLERFLNDVNDGKMNISTQKGESDDRQTCIPE